ncbi:hypothetical protein CH370_09540 [Leptospira kmetyi]|uniref:hypothetical protein n=1 Tax=Leptospira kmetyi TaxID=408139 RepID=UPI000C2A1DBA|nr:hypothetical protein [Leptospira kmetyi]PJZ41676.1 hypothetical protein CH370_09540 [Leptospira kmetyi]
MKFKVKILLLFLLLGNLSAQDQKYPIDISSIKKALALYAEFIDLRKNGKTVKADSKRAEAQSLLSNAIRPNQIISSNSNCLFKKEGFSTLPQIGLTCAGSGFVIQLSYERTSKKELEAFEDIPVGSEFLGEVKIIPNALQKAFDISGIALNDVHIDVYGQIIKIQKIVTTSNESINKKIDIDQLINDLQNEKPTSKETIIDALRQLRGY